MDKKIKKEMAQEEKAEKKMNGIKTNPMKKLKKEMDWTLKSYGINPKAEKKTVTVKGKAEPTVIEKAQTLDPKGSIWKEPKEHEPVKVHKCKNPDCPQTGKPQVAMDGYCSESKYKAGKLSEVVKKGKVVELSTIAPKEENKLFKFPSLHEGKYHLVSAPSVQEACYILADSRTKADNPHIKAAEFCALLPYVWLRSLDYLTRAANQKLQGTPTDAPKGVHGINVVDQDPSTMH